MTLAHLATAGLATWQAVEIWHHGGIFADRRSRVELWTGAVGGFFRDLLGCPFCLSVWVAFLLTLLLHLGDWWAVPVYALAASRLANVGNDVTRGVNRTPKAGSELADDQAHPQA